MLVKQVYGASIMQEEIEVYMGARSIYEKGNSMASKDGRPPGDIGCRRIMNRTLYNI